MDHTRLHLAGKEFWCVSSARSQRKTFHIVLQAHMNRDPGLSMASISVAWRAAHGRDSGACRRALAMRLSVCFGSQSQMTARRRWGSGKAVDGGHRQSPKESITGYAHLPAILSTLLECFGARCCLLAINVTARQIQTTGRMFEHSAMAHLLLLAICLYYERSCFSR
jgi:hypothetical protein